VQEIFPGEPTLHADRVREIWREKWTIDVELEQGDQSVENGEEIDVKEIHDVCSTLEASLPSLYSLLTDSPKPKRFAQYC
ncbi:hypothetical protein RJ035_004246, partial [Blastomyces gilchristii]